MQKTFKQVRVGKGVDTVSKQDLKVSGRVLSSLTSEFIFGRHINEQLSWEKKKNRRKEGKLSIGPEFPIASNKNFKKNSQSDLEKLKLKSLTQSESPSARPHGTYPELCGCPFQSTSCYMENTWISLSSQLYIQKYYWKKKGDLGLQKIKNWGQ